MSYATEELGKCDICAHQGPRSMFVIVHEDEAMARAKVEFALGDNSIPDDAPYWGMFHDTWIPIPEGMAMTCPPGQHLAWERINGCPKWELDTKWAGIHWRLDARGREDRWYRVDHASDLSLNCRSCVHRREINDVILNPGRYEVGCNAGMDTNPHREAFEAQLARPRYNIYDPPRDPEGQIIPPADDEPIFLMGADPMTNLYLWQIEYIDLIFHNEETVRKHGLAPCRWSINWLGANGSGNGSAHWSTAFALINLGVPNVMGMDFEEKEASIREYTGSKNRSGAWVRRKINGPRKKMGMPAWKSS